MATADGRLEFFRTHAGGASAPSSSGRSGLAPRPREVADAARAESVGQKPLSLDGLKSPQQAAMFGLRDSLSLGGGMQRAAQYVAHPSHGD
jgi:hypothetical protein